MLLILITQVQVNENRQISFGQSIRAFLRHDPDIILVGEIRDEATAQEALRAAMTGHQVFSTLHTNRALDAILRLHDLGLPLVNMADYLSMIISQRLVRKLCPHCKEKKEEGYVAHGCKHCRHGYMGQTVVAEILCIDETIRDLMTQGNIVALKQYIKQSKHPAMQDDAKRLVALGITSQEEIQRVLGS